MSEVSRLTPRSAPKAGSAKAKKANASRSLQWICLIGPLGMKRGRGMRQEYSTTGARKQEASRLRGLFSNRFVSEWTYILGLAAGRCRGVGWGAGGSSRADDSQERQPPCGGSILSHECSNCNPPCRMPPDVPTNVPTISSVRRYVLGDLCPFLLPVPNDGRELLRAHLAKRTVHPLIGL